jgi:hypothetical protein
MKQVKPVTFTQKMIDEGFVDTKCLIKKEYEKPWRYMSQNQLARQRQKELDEQSI